MKNNKGFIFILFSVSVITYLVYSIFEIGYEFTVLRFLAILPFFYLFASVLQNYKSRIDLLLPEIYIGLSLLVGTTLKTIWLTSVDSLNFTKQQSVLLGQDLTDLYFPLFIINIAIVSFLFGKKINLNYFKVKVTNNIFILKKRNFKILIMFACFVSVIGMFFLLKSVGVTEIIAENISDKRRVFDENGQRNSFAWLRVFGKFAKFAFYLGVLYFLTYRISNSQNKMIRFLTILSLLITIVYSVINSSRTVLIDVGIISIFCFIVAERKIPKKLVGVMIALAILISGFIISKRDSKETSFNDNLFYSIIESITANNNLFGVSKTGKISNHVLNKSSYYFGSTYLTWIYAPIPRSIWEDKPPITPGLIVRKDILGENSDNNLGGGIPPGLVAESFMNFGFIGIIFIPILLGSFVNFVFKKIKKLILLNKIKSINPLTILILLNVYLEFTFKIFGGSLTQSLIGVLEAVVILKILSYIKIYQIWKLKT
jgi:oligosaccharide repeat unit polymerase